MHFVGNQEIVTTFHTEIFIFCFHLYTLRTVQDTHRHQETIPSRFCNEAVYGRVGF